MSNTLKAVVEGDRIHWLQPMEDILPPDRPVNVLVTLLGEEAQRLPPQEQGKRRLAAVQKLIASHAFSGIEDPVQWQNEVRKDRELPGKAA